MVQDRFGRGFGNEYATVAQMTEFVKANVNTPKVRQRRIAEAQENAVRYIRDYVVEGVASIARYDSPADAMDFDTPLGDSLPANLTPEHAAELAGMLRAALPRVRELLALLDRRASEGQSDEPSRQTIQVIRPDPPKTEHRSINLSDDEKAELTRNRELIREQLHR